MKEETKKKEKYIPKYSITCEQFFKYRRVNRFGVTYDKSYSLDDVYEEFNMFCKIYKYVYLYKYSNMTTIHQIDKQEVTCPHCNQKVTEHEDVLIEYTDDEEFKRTELIK
jgi:hypothetical protein